MSNKNTRSAKDKIIIITAMIILFAVFGSALSGLYIYRENIINILNYGVWENQNDKTPARTQATAISGGVVSFSDDALNPLNPCEYFSDIIFIGDSILTGFVVCREYIEFDGEKVLRDAVVAATPGYGLNNAVSDVEFNSVNLIYNNKAMRPEEIIAERNEKYVFICLGLNDLVIMSPEKYIEKYGVLIDNIQSKTPDKIIVILSVTPLVAGQQAGSMSNDAIIKANALLLEFAIERNIPFVDWAEAIRDTDKSLINRLSSDGYCHLNVSAYNRLVEYLICHRVR